MCLPLPQPAEVTMLQATKLGPELCHHSVANAGLGITCSPATKCGAHLHSGGLERDAPSCVDLPPNEVSCLPCALWPSGYQAAPRSMHRETFCGIWPVIRNDWRALVRALASR